jgi:hypothetical protein
MSVYGTTWRRWGALSQIATIALGLVAAGACLRSTDSPALLRRIFVTTGVIAAIYGICQYFGWEILLDRRLYVSAWDGEVVRPPSTFGHALYFANYLAMATSAALSGAVFGRKRMWRLLYAGSAVLMAVAIVMSGTRSGLIATIAGAVAVGFQTSQRAAKLRIFALIVASILVAAFISILSIGAPIRHRMVQWTSDLQGGTRLLVWRDSLRMAWLGHGLAEGADTFGMRFPRYESQELAQKYPDHFHESSHNIYIDELTNNGVAGLIGLFGASLLFWNHARKGAIEHWAVPAALSLLVGHLFAVWTIPTAAAFHVLLGVHVASNREAKDRLARRRAPIYARAVAACCGACLLVAAVQLLANDWGEARVLSMLKAGSIAEAIESHRGLPWLGMRGPNHAGWFARQLVGLAANASARKRADLLWKEAEAAARSAALSGEDRIQATQLLGVILLGRGDLPAAEESCRRAADLAPNWYAPYVVLATIHREAGRTSEAESDEQRALELNPSLSLESLRGPDLR